MKRNNRIVLAVFAASLSVSVVALLFVSEYSNGVAFLLACIAVVPAIVTNIVLPREGEEFFTVLYPQGKAAVWLLRMADDLTRVQVDADVHGDAIYAVLADFEQFGSYANRHAPWFDVTHRSGTVNLRKQHHTVRIIGYGKPNDMAAEIARLKQSRAATS